MDKLRKKVFIFIATILITAIFALDTYAITVPKEIDLSLVTTKFVGKWVMQTIVTESKCPYVLIGTTTESNLEIKPVSNLKKGEMLFKTMWTGGNWAKSTGILKVLSGKEAISERVTEYLTQDNTSWKAILIDHLKADDQDTIYSESLVIQYKNGLNVGEYKTYSILTKVEE